MRKSHCGLSGMVIHRRGPISRPSNSRLPKMETAMLTKEIQNRFSTPVISRAGKVGKGVVLAGAIAALLLTAIPTSAQAGGNGVGAAIGLGVLGGVLAGAAIASSA